MIPIITAFFSNIFSKIDKKIFIAIFIVIIVAIFILLIASKDSKIQQKEKEIAQYQENIKGLELKNQTLQNEIQFMHENEEFKNSFSNSDIMIKNIDKELLSRKEYETFNNISNNFYKYFNSIFYQKRFKNSPKSQTVLLETVCADFFRFNISFLQYKDKICENTSFYTAGNIYYKTCYEQTRFNEKIPRKYYKDRTMAIMV